MTVLNNNERISIIFKSAVYLFFYNILYLKSYY